MYSNYRVSYRGVEGEIPSPSQKLISEYHIKSAIYMKELNVDDPVSNIFSLPSKILILRLVPTLCVCVFIRLYH